jgi:SAM-dependent methyltransferase
MVCYANLTEINNAFSPVVGTYDYIDVSHRPHGQTALQLAALTTGNTVLELGSGSGRLLAEAKVAVGSGFCVGVDAVQGFLDVDIPAALANKGLAVYPNGTLATQVHLLRANVTDGALVNRIRALPGAPHTFDRIFVLHVITTIPALQRRQFLRCLHTLLTPTTGRLVLNMDAQFSDIPPLPAELNTPVQFRSTGHTQAPGATMLSAFQQHSFQATASGVLYPEKRVVTAVQFAADRLWVIAAQQATAAVVNAGFGVDTVRDIGKADDLGLARGGHSPSLSVLNNMSLGQLSSIPGQVARAGEYGCAGRAMEAACRLTTPGWHQMTPSVRDYTLAMWLQRQAEDNKQRVDEMSVHLPAKGVVRELVESTHVGVLLLLRKN